jgi:hydrogenase nickel incorporation protein HypA/HybF
MHEMGIANSILEGVAKELRQRPGARAVKVGVRIGELAGVDPDALSFAFEALTLDTPFASLALDVEYGALRSRCRECSHEFEVRNYDLLCPACGSLNTERISGDELEFSYLEIEESESGETGRAGPQLAESKVAESPTAESQARELEVEKQ